MKVLNFGSLNIDYVYSVDHIMREGETQACMKMERFCGGKGMNQSIALAKAGVGVFHAGMVGADGEWLLEMCQKSGVDTRYIRKTDGKSGHTIIQVDKNAQNCILLYGGANREITEEYIDEVLNEFEKGDIILLQNEVNLLDKIIEKAYEKEMIIILNPSPMDEAIKKCDLNKVSILLLNEIEGEQITGVTEPEKILDKLNALYPDMKVVLTLGGNGSVYQEKEKRCKQEIFPVKPVDTTAAGDTFTGYFIASVLEGMSVESGMEMAAKAASIAVSRKGAAASIPYREEVEKKLQVR